MATIGTFTKTENGYTGAAKTLTLNVKARIVAAEEQRQGTGFPGIRWPNRLCVARDYAESLACSRGFLPVLAVCASHNPMELLLAAHCLS